MKNNLKNTIATAMPYVAVFGATGAAIYVFAKAYSAIKDIGKDEISEITHFNS